MRVSWAGLLLSSILLSCAARPPPPTRELSSAGGARARRPAEPVKIGCDGPLERIEQLAAPNPASSTDPARTALLAATASQQLGQWATAAERWRDLAAIDPAWPRGAVWRVEAIDALIEASRWDTLCPVVAEHLAALPAKSSTITLVSTTWLPKLHEAALAEASPQALSAARCVNEAAATARLRLPIQSARLRRLRALLDCAAGDRAGALAELTTIAASSTTTWGYDAGLDAARIRADQPCAPSGPLETVPPREASLAKDEVGAVIKKSLDRFRRCYELRLSTFPGSRGRVLVHFAIDHDGGVPLSMIVGSTMEDPWTEACVAQTMSSLRFPVARPASGKHASTLVTYPFVFCST